MVLVRVWRRRLLGGIGAAAVVPGMLLGSIVVLTLAGGFGGLTALGQAFSGPPAPAAAIATGHGARANQPLSPPIVAALSAAPARPAAASSAPLSSSGGATGVVPHGAVPSRPRGRPHRGSGTGTQSPPSGRPVPAGRPAPKPQPTLIDGIVGAGSSVTSQLPAPAGSAATNALQSAGSTLDSIAPVKGP
jgi:hypothetical protein